MSYFVKRISLLSFNFQGSLCVYICFLFPQLRDKDKQNIKDKFAGFNKEMEEITRIQKAYAVPDVQLRESLKRDNKEFILPKYTMFYEK